MAEGFYCYYRTERPMAFPHPKNNMPVAFLNYYELRDVEGGTVRAWGELWYSRPLSQRMIEKFGLCPSASNPKLDRAAPKPRIAAQMEAAGKLAQANREIPGQQKAAPDRGGDR